MRKLPQLTPVGTTFSYNNASIAVAGHVIERITKKRFEDAVQALVLDPLGMSETTYVTDEIIGFNVAAGHVVVDGKATVTSELWTLPRSMNPFGGAISSVRERLRYARFHLGDGTGKDGKRVMSQASLRAMRANPGPGGTLLVELDGMGVSRSIRRSAEGPKIIQHGGDVPAQHSGMMFVPDRNFAMTMLTNAESGPRLVEELFFDDWALSRFAGLHNLPASPQLLDASALAAYEGKYSAQQVPFTGPTIEVPADVRGQGGRLQFVIGEGADAASKTLTFYKRDYFFVNDSDGSPLYVRGNFVRDAQGRIAWLGFGGRLFRNRG